MSTLQLIKDSHNRICILGKATEVSEGWLKIQEKPFKPNPTLHSAYPLNGGAVVVDINDVKILRDVIQSDIDLATKSENFNPASDTILKLCNGLLAL